VTGGRTRGLVGNMKAYSVSEAENHVTRRSRPVTSLSANLPPIANQYLKRFSCECKCFANAVMWRRWHRRVKTDVASLKETMEKELAHIWVELNCHDSGILKHQ